MASHVDHTEHDVDVFVTEQGIADVRGLLPVECTERIIEHCAHPEFAPELRSYLEDICKQDNHIQHDIECAAE